MSDTLSRVAELQKKLGDIRCHGWECAVFDHNSCDCYAKETVAELLALAEEGLAATTRFAWLRDYGLQLDNWSEDGWELKYCDSDGNEYIATGLPIEEAIDAGMAVIAARLPSQSTTP